MPEEPRRGICHVCGRSMTVTKTGAIRTHGDKKSWPPANCPGSGLDPDIWVNPSG
jgi:hypothetical protein